MTELKKIRGTLVKLLAYIKKQGEDFSSWRTPGRWDFFIQSLITEAGGRTKIPISFAKKKAVKYGYGWTAGLEEALNTALSVYGISLSNESEVELENYWSCRDNFGVKNLIGKTWK